MPALVGFSSLSPRVACKPAKGHLAPYASTGGIALRAGTIAVLVESTIADCAAGDASGGGLFLGYQSNATLKGGSLVECCTAYRGGGILAYEADLELLEGSVVRECHTPFCAGGLHLRQSHRSRHRPHAHHPEPEGATGRVQAAGGCGRPALRCRACTVSSAGTLRTHEGA